MRKYLFYLLALLFVTACNDEFGNNDPNHGENLPFGTNAKFLRLQDDSTNVAGVLEIKAKTPNVKLKWMVSSECNLDTTITEVRLSGGRYQLPIKWAGKLKDGMYGPISSAYIAGVQVISGEESKYVPLVWADEVDSLEIIKRVEEQNIMTRSGTGEFATEIITLLDSVPFQLDKDTCGKIRFETSAALLLTAKNELTDLVNENNFNLDISKIKSTYIGSPNSLDFLWTDAGAPEQDFMGHVKLIPAGSTIGKYVYFQ